MRGRVPRGVRADQRRERDGGSAVASRRSTLSLRELLLGAAFVAAGRARRCRRYPRRSVGHCFRFASSACGPRAGTSKRCRRSYDSLGRADQGETAPSQSTFTRSSRSQLVSCVITVGEARSTQRCPSSPTTPKVALALPRSFRPNGSNEEKIGACARSAMRFGGNRGVVREDLPTRSIICEVLT